MKRVFFIFSAIALFAFSGCQDRNQFGDDYYITDSSIGIPYSSSDESTTTLVQYDNASVEESNSQLILNAKQSQSDGTIYIKWTCTFSDGKLTKSVRETTFPTESSAGAYYAQLKENYERGLEFYLKDNVVIENDTELYTEGLSGITKSYIRERMLTIAEEINNGKSIVNIADNSSSASLNLCPDDNHPHAIDMGTGVKWACCNVGASSPVDYGGYYAWGETSTKSNYDWSTYKWCNGSKTSMTKYCTDSSYGTVDNKTTLELSDDAARVNWGSSWRMPTIDELSELNNNCTWTWMTIEDVNGYKVTASNGNSIFLPAAGYRNEESLSGVGSGGVYWSSSSASGAYDARYLTFDSGNRSTSYYYDYRYYGQSVRPVMKMATTR